MFITLSSTPLTEINHLVIFANFTVSTKYNQILCYQSICHAMNCFHVGNMQLMYFQWTSIFSSTTFFVIYLLTYVYKTLSSPHALTAYLEYKYLVVKYTMSIAYHSEFAAKLFSHFPNLHKLRIPPGVHVCSLIITY